MKFAANLAFLFVKETSSLVERYQLARAAGFSAVELPFPYDVPVEDISEAKIASGLEQVLLNAWPGDLTKGELGIAIFPERQEQFRESIEKSLTYLEALDCKRLHIMSGKVTADSDMARCEEVYEENLRYAADRLQKAGVLALIEPCNNQWIPGYFMNDPRKAVELIKKINHPNLKLQLDIFHAQIIQGNLTRCIKDYLPYIGHIQVAQVPERSEPDSSGEINYDYVFRLLNEVGYNGWIGLEYIPRGMTVEGLKFLENWK